MRSLLIVAVAVMIGFSLAAADLAGTWKGSMDTQMGTMDFTIAIQPGAALAGKVTIGEYTGAIENGKVDGDRISFEINLEVGKIASQGTVAGDEMKLNVTGTQGNQYTVTCKRQK
jgi:hypothetical protein